MELKCDICKAPLDGIPATLGRGDAVKKACRDCAQKALLRRWGATFREPRRKRQVTEEVVA